MSTVRRLRRPRVLGVGAPKGGVGKTQTAVTLAHLASLAGYRVLLVDADPNASAEDWVMRGGDRFNLALAADDNTANLVRLRELTDYDVIVVDMPGARTAESFTALLRGANGRPVLDALVVPSKVATMDLRPTTRIVLEAVVPSGVPYLLVGTMADGRRMDLVHQDLDELVTVHGVRVARTVVRELLAHTEAVREDRPITDLPGGRRSGARQAEAEYRRLAREVFVGLLRIAWPDTPATLDAPTDDDDTDDDTDRE